MIPKILITNGGPHSAEKWAELSASEIISVAESADFSAVGQAGRKLENSIIDIFERFHDAIIKAENAHLDNKGTDHLATPIDGSGVDVSAVVTQIQNAAKGTPFEAHFQKPEVITAITNITKHHVELIMEVERSWFADKAIAGGSDVAKSWQETRHALGRGLAHTALIPDQPIESSVTETPHVHNAPTPTPSTPTPATPVKQ